MPALETKPQFKIGDKVRVKSGPQSEGYISEIWFARFGSGRILYRIRVERDPEPLWLEVPESEVELV